MMSKVKSSLSLSLIISFYVHLCVCVCVCVCVCQGSCKWAADVKSLATCQGRPATLVVAFSSNDQMNKTLCLSQGVCVQIGPSLCSCSSLGVSCSLSVFLCFCSLLSAFICSAFLPPSLQLSLHSCLALYISLSLPPSVSLVCLGVVWSTLAKPKRHWALCSLLLINLLLVLIYMSCLCGLHLHL